LQPRGIVSGPKRNSQILSPLDFLAEFTQQIPPKGSHLIRYYRRYPTRCEGEPCRIAARGVLNCQPVSIHASRDRGGYNRDCDQEPPRPGTGRRIVWDPVKEEIVGVNGPAECELAPHAGRGVFNRRSAMGIKENGKF